MGAITLVLIGSASGCHRHPSWQSNSYYVGSGSVSKINQLGCQNGGKQGRMTLFFGAPTRVGSGVGTTLWAAKNRRTSGIGELARAFVRGYARCRQSSHYQLLIGLGTSNSGIDGKSDQWLRRHGRAWATMVRGVSNWADRHYPGVVRIYGAWDAEPSWSSYHKAAQWMNGYQGLRGVRPLYANFSADGCSWTSSNNAGCNNGWNQRRMWDLAWKRPPSMPIPQLYANSGVNSRQWQKISEYGARHHNRPLTFYGTMTQAGACDQVGGCRGTTNAPHSARDQLLAALNAHPRTKQAEIQSTTDMRWHS